MKDQLACSETLIEDRVPQLQNLRENLITCNFHFYHEIKSFKHRTETPVVISLASTSFNSGQKPNIGRVGIDLAH